VPVSTRSREAAANILWAGGYRAEERVDDRQDMRVSDADRQETVERLRSALDEGRLKMEEYLERMGRAYEAVTYGDLAVLCRDLPEASVARRPAPQAAGPAPQAAGPAPQAADHRGAFARLPGVLKVLWTIWLVAVSVNVIVWVLVTSTAGHLIYPWPVWVAGPYGAALLAISAPVSMGRRNRRPASPPLPPGSRPLPPGSDS
jgi:Domain of unknown function (DUF1707)